MFTWTPLKMVTAFAAMMLCGLERVTLAMKLIEPLLEGE
jgi:hypothetical protein